jgi:pimeloyl-ACP methyl ester carboxylesterase
LGKVRAADGTTIALEVWGEGPPLVLVVGAFCDSNTLKGLAARLAGKFTVFRYDRRGRGGSGDAYPYAVEREIEDLEAVLGAAGGSAYIYGHSSGAVLALESAAHGAAVKKVVAYEPPYLIDGSRVRHHADLAARLEELVAEGRRGDAAELFLTEAVGLSRETISMVRSGPMWRSMRAVAHTLAYDVTVCNQQSIPPGLMSKIQAPTLLVAGSASGSWARSAIEALAAEIPDAETLVIPGEDHGVSDDAIVPVLEKFYC